MSKKINIAVLMTCHNRKKITLQCLDALFLNHLPNGYSLEVFLVDDGSTDGTSDAVYKKYPQIIIIKGDGNLFWSGGMRLAFSKALEKGFNYYLWLNDDSILKHNALKILFDCYKKKKKVSGDSQIIVGCMSDPVSGKLTYGGNQRKKSYINKIKMKRVDYLEGSIIPADTINGNCVLIPNDVARQLGNIDNAYVHSLGDYDYGLRASSLGIKIWITPYFVGTCICDHVDEGTYKDKSLDIKTRMKNVFSEKGLPPHAWLVYCRRHAGFFWPLIWANRYIQVFLSSLFRT